MQDRPRKDLSHLLVDTLEFLSVGAIPLPIGRGRDEINASTLACKSVCQFYC